MRSLAPKRYLYGSRSAQEVEGRGAARGGQLERVQDQQVAQPVARVGAVPARLVGGECVAPPEAVEDPDDPVVVARDHSRRPALGPGARRQRQMEGELVDAERAALAPARVQLEQRAQQPLVELAGRDPVEAHALALDPAGEPAQLALEVLRRRTGLGGERESDPRAGVAVELAGPARAAPAPASPAPRRARAAASAPAPRLARRDTSSPSPSATSQAVWSPTPTPLPELVQTGTARGTRRCSRWRSRLSATSASRRPDPSLQAASRVRGRPASASHQASTQSGVWKYELSSTRPASSSQSRRSPASPATASRSATSGSMRAACAAPRSAFPRGRSSPPSPCRPARSGPARAATG